MSPRGIKLNACAVQLAGTFKMSPGTIIQRHSLVLQATSICRLVFTFARYCFSLFSRSAQTMQTDAVSCSSNTTTSSIATALQQQQPSSTTTNQISSDTSSDSGLSIAQVTEEEDTSSPESSRSYRPDRRKQRRNPAVLVQWIEEHNSNPYPTKTEKQHLAALSGTTLRQLNDWFANARRNIKKLGYHTWRKKKGIPGCSTTNAPGKKTLSLHNDFIYCLLSKAISMSAANNPLSLSLSLSQAIELLGLVI